MNTRHLKLPLALGLALVASQAQALGLGQIEVKSGLNQPLLAEIPILSATPLELEELEVRLASPEAFARVGLERPVGLTANLQMVVARNSRGQPIIRVTTPGRFNEPFLTFLLEANTGRGGVIREFSALVDPPYIAPAVIRPLQTPAVAAVAAPAPVIAAPVRAPEPVSEPTEAETVAVVDAEPAPVEATPEPEPVVMAAPPPPAPQPVVAQAEPAPEPVLEPAPIPEAPPAPEPEPEIVAPPPPPPPQLVATPPPPEPVAAPAPQPEPEPAALPERYGPVGAGQTLWSIANSVRPDASISVNQMMLALQRANPEAFIGDNINSLKRGAVLRIPVSDEVAAVSAAQAAALVREQADAWQSRRAPVPQPAEAVAVEPAPEAAAPPAAAAPRPAARPAARPPQARLAIVPPSGNARDARGAQSGASQAGGGSELRAQLSQAREDLAAREAEVTELKSRVAQLESEQATRQSLVDMQSSQLKALQDRLAELEKQPSATPADAAAAPDTAAAPAAIAGTDPASSSASAEPPPAAAPSPTPAATAPAETSTAAATTAPEAAAEPWYLSPWILGGGALALLAGLVLALRGRPREGPMLPVRRISDDDALKASLAANAPAPPAPTPAPVVTPAATQPAAPKPAAPKPAPMPEPAIKVPPPERATAPSKILPPAPAAQPSTENTLKTLVDAVRARPKDPEAHINLLRHHYTRGEAREYEAAAQALRAQVGNTLDPHWREAVVMGAALLPGNPLFSEAGWNKPRFAETESAAPAPPPPSPSAPAPAPVAKAAPEATRPAQSTPDDLADLESLVLTEPSLAAGSTAADEDWTRLTVEGADDDSGFAKARSDADIHRTEAEVLAEDEGSATKIELAKAYLEIGDADGARGMLQEVLAEGGPLARTEAQRLLNEIG